MLLCVSVTGDFTGEPYARACWEEMLDALDAVSPLIDDVGPGLAFLDMHGIAGDARAWMAQTRTVLARFGLGLRIGVGVE